MHGAGNDFVVIDLRHGRPAPAPALCRALADRHTGVGCDQILTIEDPRSPHAVASYGIFNADGSRAGQCGNGARCVAAWLVREGVARDAVFTVDSPAGAHEVTRLPDGTYRIAMGVPRWAPEQVPLRGFTAAQETYRLDVDGQSVEFGAVSMGNPHAVIEVADATSAPVHALGARLQRDAAFPDSVNVGFAQVESRGRVRLRVYERGVGETLACGSGACAAAAVLMRRDRIDRDVAIALPGGELRIAWPRDDAPITMAGPAAFVFEGEWMA
ncbi:diaminopimelate epimerase [Agrilutibacter solisilvae]|nr:diaminopimelate epimerase [Lysobacter solisilvae]